jgi:PAS domain S-box-containing protein
MGKQAKGAKKKKPQELVKELQESRTALMNILEDVDAERQKAEEEKNKTATVITNLADGLLLFDVENKLSLINSQAEKMLNLKKEDVVGKTILELTSYPAAESISNLLQRETSKIFREEIELQKNLVLEVTTTQVIMGKEQLGTLVILHDVSREKLVERMKTEFVSLVAHQLRTPLSAIKWTVRILLDRELGEITKEQQDFLEKIYQANERMISLINDLLNVARIEEGRYIYKPILVSIELLVQSVVNSYKEQLEGKGIVFDLKRPERPLPQVLIDAEKMTLTVQNLLANAILYTPKGGSVTISLKCVNNEVEFSIKDTGVGIPRDQQERIFTKFFRGTNVLRMETEGTGLGLFIAKNVVEAHGGRIWFESKEGQGSTFYFTLPIR